MLPFMRKLILLRHAHAAMPIAQQADRDRPLSAHGLLEAEAAGRWLQQHGHLPDQVLCSPALRCRQTVETLASSLNLSLDVSLQPRIYEATPGTLIALLDEYWQQESSVLLVGHNPGLERLLALLSSGQSGHYRGMPPASIALLSFPSTATALEPASACLSAFWSP